MKLNKTDYMLECTSDGGYYAWLTVNMQCNAYGDSPEEAVKTWNRPWKTWLKKCIW